MAAGGRAAWLLPLRPLLLVVVVAALGVAFGLGNSAILGGTIATYLLTAAFGASLYSDARLLVRLGTVIVAVIGLISFLNGPVPLAADLLVLLAVFVAGLVPVLGARFVTVGAGLGTSAVVARAMSGTAVGAFEAFGAPALAVAVVLVLRVLAGRSDPDGPLRTVLADALVDTATSTGQSAAQLIDLHRSCRWVTDAMTGLVQYRNAGLLLTARRAGLAGAAAREVDRHRAQAEEEATRLAEALRAVDPPGTLAPARHDPPSAGLPGATKALVSMLWRGLDRVRVATATRDGSDVDSALLPPRPRVVDTLRGELRWRSVQLRHAVRTVLGMTVALALLRFHTTPFGFTFLLAAYTTMQPTWGDSLRKAGERVAGTLIGAFALGVVIRMDLPQVALTGLGLVGLVLGYYFMRSRPVLGNAGMLFMSVAVTSTTRALDTRLALGQALEVSAVGVAIGLVFGFVAVPGVRRPGPRERLADAVAAQRDLLGDVADALRTGTVDRRTLVRSGRAMVGALSNLTAYQAGAARTDDQVHAAERTAEALRGMSATALALLPSPMSTTDSTAGATAALADAVAEIADQLRPGRDPDPKAVIALLPGHTADATAAQAETAEEQELTVDSMISGLLAVREIDTALAAVAR